VIAPQPLAKIFGLLIELGLPLSSLIDPERLRGGQTISSLGELSACWDLMYRVADDMSIE
jgi:hypothetical protein